MYAEWLPLVVEDAEDGDAAVALAESQTNMVEQLL